ALAAELDAQYVQELLQDDLEPDPEPEPQAEVALPGEDDLDTAFDLSLDDLDGLEGLGMDDPQAPQATPPADIAALDDLDFDTLLQEQTQAQAEPQPVPEAVAAPADVAAEPAVEPAATLDDLADFDLDMGLDAVPPAAEPQPEAPLDIEAELAAFDESLGLDDSFPDLALADDFDLSLADEPDPLADSFTAELDDVNAELDKLSQSLEQPSIEPHFTADDAADLLLDEPEFDYLAGTDEAATKLDLARAYIDMGDNDGARDILDEVMKEGTEAQRKEAIDLRSQMN
ncbi:peptidoglycan-binding protein, partial [Pseudomonas sp. MAFF212427]